VLSGHFFALATKQLLREECRRTPVHVVDSLGKRHVCRRSKAVLPKKADVGGARAIWRSIKELTNCTGVEGKKRDHYY